MILTRPRVTRPRPELARPRPEFTRPRPEPKPELPKHAENF